MIKNYLVFDTETTTFQKGNPFSRCNKMVALGVMTPDSAYYTKAINIFRDKFQRQLDTGCTIVGFNLKFDLHWIRRYGFNFTGNRTWDCQLAHFMLSGQTTPYPSLNQVAEHYGLGVKLDVVKTEYWDKGIDTDNIPEEVLLDYLRQDVALTYSIFLKQQEEFTKYPTLYRLFQLQCKDLLVLEEMEYNGIHFDTATASELGRQESNTIKEIELKLMEGYDNIPLNFQSHDHLSAYLYGGNIVEEQRMPIGFYKTGAKAGHQRFKKVEFTHTLPRLVAPAKNSELAKEGYYATDEPTLKTLKANKDVKKRLDLLLKRAKSSKLLGTYYEGIPKLIREMDWPENTIHGNFNQCVAATGRLSSSKPNLQNFAGDVDKLLRSTYA